MKKGKVMSMKRRNKRSGWQKERMGIIAASVFVLSALTLTGVYIANQEESSPEENLIDFAKLEKQSENSNDEEQIADNSELNNDMDIDPNYTEVNSGQVRNDRYGNTSLPLTGSSRYVKAGEPKLENTIISEEKNNNADAPKLTFGDKTSLKWPIAGKVLLNYSMDKAIYFPTLKQYKYNPSIVIAANKGENITAAADGVVKDIYKDIKTGNTVVFELGNGYELTYGQLSDIALEKGQFIKAGDLVGKVEDPTIYYSEEGCNVYFMLTKDGSPVNPLEKLDIVQ